MDLWIRLRRLGSKLAPSWYVLRRAIAFLLIAGACSYLAGIVLGKIPEQQKLGPADVVIILAIAIVAGVLLRPELLDRLTHLKLGNVELDWLQRLEKDQQAQRSELDGVRFVLTLLLQQSEQEHLKNLQKGNTQDYAGNYALRAELRKLRALRLIQNRNNHTIGEMTDGRRFNLRELVELTDRGKHYLEWVGEYKEGRD